MKIVTEDNQNSLIRYCQFAHESSFRIERLINFDFERLKDSEAESLKRSLEFLRARTKRAEVRILVLGPLKAGKSTLMNVLVSDPHISQISALPAYPCFVEVKDLERDSDGNPTEKPRAIFYAPDNRIVREATQREGEAYLNALLDEFMAQGDQAELRCERVEQRIAMPRSPDGLSLTLIDSPGLFFSRKVDDRFFSRSNRQPALDAPSQVGESEYSNSTKRLYVEADVVIFVIRPEQLFFHVVSEWLRDFIRDEVMRVFILVNASTRSKTQEGDQFIDYNQVERADEIRGYFIKHVADDLLKAKLAEDNKLSLKFSDLLEVATSMFAENGGTSQLAPSISGQVIAEIRQYIAGENLAARKVENIKDLLRRTLAEGQNYLFQIKSKREKKQAELAQAHQDTKNKIERVSDELTLLKSFLTDTEQELVKTQNRRNVVQQYFDKAEEPKSKEDNEIKQFSDLLGVNPTTMIALIKDEQRLRRQIEEIQQQIGKIYVKWQAKEMGNRSLTRLAEVVWKETATDAKTVLAQYIELLRQASTQFLQHAGNDSLSPSLLRAVKDVSASELSFNEDNPILRLKPLPLFKFEPRKRWWKLKMALTPERMWGENGNNYVGEEGNEILQAEKKTFLSCIWEDWELDQIFSANHIGQTAKGACLRQIAQMWLKRLEPSIAEIQNRITQLKRDIGGKEKELAEAATMLRQIEKQLEEIVRQIGEIENNARSLSEIAEQGRNSSSV